MVCTLCLGFHLIISFPKKKKRCREKTINFQGSDPEKISHSPSMGVSNLLEHTHHPCGLENTSFFWKNKSSKKNRDPAIVGRTPSHLYTTPIPFPFSNPLVRMGNSMGRLPERGSHYWESLESPLKKAPTNTSTEHSIPRKHPQLISGIPKLINCWLKIWGYVYAGIFSD